MSLEDICRLSAACRTLRVAYSSNSNRQGITWNGVFRIHDRVAAFLPGKTYKSANPLRFFWKVRVSGGQKYRGAVESRTTGRARKSRFLCFFCAQTNIIISRHAHIRGERFPMCRRCGVIRNPGRYTSTHQETRDVFCHEIRKCMKRTLGQFLDPDNTCVSDFITCRVNSHESYDKRKIKRVTPSIVAMMVDEVLNNNSE